MSYILVERKREGVAVLTMNRPEKRNAVNQKMAEEMLAALTDLAADRSLKLLVVTGAGDRAFCAGGDLEELHGDISGEEAFRLLSPMKDVLYALALFPLPTIALLNGDARGGGCEIATACDFRYAVPGTKAGFIQGSLGIIPGWGGGVLLYRKVRPETAVRWLMEASMFDMEEAYHYGWLHKKIMVNIDHLFAPFTAKSIKQLRVLKEQYVRELGADELAERMEAEVRTCSDVWDSKEHKEAVRRFRERKR